MGCCGAICRSTYEPTSPGAEHKSLSTHLSGHVLTGTAAPPAQVMSGPVGAGGAPDSHPLLNLGESDLSPSASLAASSNASTLSAAPTTFSTPSQQHPVNNLEAQNRQAEVSHAPPPCRRPISAMQLVRRVEGKFEVCPEAASVLNGLGLDPLAVVSVAGSMRDGKSFIMNRLSGVTGGFAVSDAHIDPCTFGIWLWPKPLEVSGQAHRVVLLDTEGTASIQQNSQSDAALVALTGLISSLLIYNKKRGLDRSVLEELLKIAHIMGHLFKINKNSSAAELAKATPPSLLVLVRDYATFEEDVEGALDKVLADDDEEGWNAEETKKKNATKATIRRVFGHRMAHALPHPRFSSDGQTSNDFDQGVEELSRRVLSSATPKRLNGVAVTGPMMVQLLQVAVTAANSGDVPQVGSVWQSMVDQEIKAAADAAIAAYRSRASATALAECISEVEAIKLHQASLELAEAAFHANIHVARSESARASSWASITDQLAQGLKLVIEGIKRQQAEALVELNVALKQAKRESIEAFGQERFLEECSQEACNAAEVFAEHKRAAYTTYNEYRDTWYDAWNCSRFVSDQDMVSANDQAELELEKELKAILDLAFEKKRTTLATADAERIGAEKKKLEQQMLWDQQSQDAVDEACRKYQEDMQAALLKCKDTETLEHMHKLLLDRLVARLPALPDEYKDAMRDRLTDLCGKQYAAYEALLQQRRKDEDKAVVYRAAEEALQDFRKVVAEVEPECKEEARARRICENASQTAITKFHQLAKQQTFSRESAEYSESLQRLEIGMRGVVELLLTTVQQNAKAAQLLQQHRDEAAAAMQKLQQDTEVKLHEQKKAVEMELQQMRQKADEDRSQHEQDMQRRAADHDKQLAVARSNRQFDTTCWQMANMLQALTSQMSQMRCAAPGYGCGGGYGGGYPQTACIEEIGSSPYRPSGHRHWGMETGPEGNSFSRDSRGRALTKAGSVCGQCSKGGYCRWHNPKPR